MQKKWGTKNMKNKSTNLMDPIISQAFTFAGILSVGLLLLLIIMTPNSYHNVKEYELHHQKIVMQEAYENHDLNKVRYRVKIYSYGHDDHGVPVWKYVKTVDYGHRKPDLRE